MYIYKIKIVNYRNFEDFEMDLLPFTLIIGENNIGKSNLINAIGLVLSNEISFFKSRTLEIEDFNFNVRERFKKDIIEKKIDDISFPEVKVEIFFKDFTENEEQLAVVSDWLLEDLSTAKLTYCFSNRNPKKQIWLKELKDKVNSKKEEDKKQLINLPINDYEYIIYGGDSERKADSYFLKKIGMEILDALRDAKSELSTEGNRKLLYRILINRDLNKYDDIIKSIDQLHNNIKSESGEIGNIKKEIEDYLNKISLETETSNNKINFRFSSVELNEILKKFGLEYGDFPISIDRNGLGRNNLLYISLILSHLLAVEKQRYFRIIAIEEPEAHLNPILQKHLAINIENEGNSKNKQIIITTHSTHITSHLNIENLVVLYKDNDKISSHYILKNITNETIKNYLKKWLNATNSTMFFSRRIILVEGISEQILIPKLFEIHTEKSIEKYNCQIINVNGVAFKNFLEIIKNGYFIKCAVLTDKDTGTKTENRADKLKEDYNNSIINVVITEKTETFEKEILEYNKDDNKNQINKIMKKIRPTLYKNISDENDIDINKYFKDIENYKSDFAFELSIHLEKDKITIPDYIKNAFDFIIGATHE